MSELGKLWKDADQSVKDKYNKISEGLKEKATQQQKNKSKEKTKEVSKPKKDVVVEKKVNKKKGKASDDE